MIDELLSFLDENFRAISLSFNVLIMVLICLGLLNRRRPRTHMRIMLTCFAIDAINVLAIELRNAAIEKSIDALTKGDNALLAFHVVVSGSCIVCYGIATFTGRRLYKRGVGRRGHKLNATVFLITRLANGITAFMV